MNNDTRTGLLFLIAAAFALPLLLTYLFCTWALALAALHLMLAQLLK